MKNYLTNWKTTGTGALSVAIGLAGLFGVSVGAPVPPDASFTMIVTGLGLIFAKDGNVTGGSTKQ